jgi:hypothetical protein
MCSKFQYIEKVEEIKNQVPSVTCSLSETRKRFPTWNSFHLLRGVYDYSEQKNGRPIL